MAGRADARPRLDAAAFAEVLGRLRTWRIVGQTLGMALAATVFSVLLGVPGAYVLYRLRIPGRRVLRAFATAPFALPTVVVGVAFVPSLTTLAR